MKKLLLTLLLTLITLSSLPVVAQASTDREAYDNQRTDAYALDYFRHSTWSKKDDMKDLANRIVSGLSSDYDKAQAIQEWVSANVTYTNHKPANLTGLDDLLYGDCDTFATITLYLSQAAGLPAKQLHGRMAGGPHAWNLVYADNRWVIVDSTNRIFDWDADRWIGYFENFNDDLKQFDEAAWDGTLYFYDLQNNLILKEIKNFPLYGTLTDTYGFNPNDLFQDNFHRTPWTSTTVVDGWNNIIKVRPTNGAPTTPTTPAPIVKVDTWKQDAKGWWLEKAAGGYAKSEWVQSGSKWYLFDAAGYMKTGWAQDNGKWYFLNPAGDMATGWVQLGGVWYFLNPAGDMRTGWVQDAGKWYFLNPSGAMAQNTVTPDGHKVNASGELIN